MLLLALIKQLYKHLHAGLELFKVKRLVVDTGFLPGQSCDIFAKRHFKVNAESSEALKAEHCEIPRFLLKVTLSGDILPAIEIEDLKKVLVDGFLLVCSH